MNERIVTLSGELGEDGVALAGGAVVFKLPPIPLTLVYASFTTDVDDAALTVDIQDDTVDAVTAVAVAAGTTTPGEWISTHFGGAETPVNIAGGSVLELDVNAATAATRLRYLLYLLA
jgi:hypothetical protein